MSRSACEEITPNPTNEFRALITRTEPLSRTSYSGHWRPRQHGQAKPLTCSRPNRTVISITRRRADDRGHALVPGRGTHYCLAEGGISGARSRQQQFVNCRGPSP